MKLGQTNNLLISIEKQGPTKILKASFPLRYGKYSEIKTSEYEFRFNLNGESGSVFPKLQIQSIFFVKLSSSRNIGP